jgi:hypothetical protein
VPQLLAIEPVVAPLVSLKLMSLISCATVVGLAMRSLSVTVTVYVPSFRVLFGLN